MITFKKIEIDDVEFLNKIRNDSREYLHDNTYYSLEESYDWFKKNNPDFYIIIKDDEKIGYFRTSNLIKNESIYIGCDIDKKLRNKGYGFMSYKEFMPFISNKYNLKKIKLEVLSSNEVAIHLYKKIGFKVSQIQKNFLFRNKENVDNILMEYETKYDQI